MADTRTGNRLTRQPKRFRDANRHTPDWRPPVEVWDVPTTLTEQLLADFNTREFGQDTHDTTENKALRGGKDFPLTSRVEKLTKPYKELLSIVKSKATIKRFANTRKPYVAVNRSDASYGGRDGNHFGWHLDDVNTITCVLYIVEEHSDGEVPLEGGQLRVYTKGVETFLAHNYIRSNPKPSGMPPHDVVEYELVTGRLLIFPGEHLAHTTRILRYDRKAWRTCQQLQKWRASLRRGQLVEARYLEVTPKKTCKAAKTRSKRKEGDVCHHVCAGTAEFVEHRDKHTVVKWKAGLVSELAGYQVLPPASMSWEEHPQPKARRYSLMISFAVKQNMAKEYYRWANPPECSTKRVRTE